MSKDKPILAATMIECAADGTNSALSIRRTKKVVFTRTDFAIGRDRYGYDALVEVAVRDNLLSLALRGANNRRVECHLRYDTFWPGTGAKRLAELQVWLSSQTVTQPASHSIPVVRAEQLNESGSVAVRVFGTEVAFPPVCPVCMRPATRVAELPVSSGLDAAVWFVPVCAQHRGMGNAVGVQGWSLRARELMFRFNRVDYGERFVALNAGKEQPAASAVASALREITAGTRFVIFSYAVSGLVVSFKQPSGVCVVPSGRSAVVAGLPYTLLTLAFGWWGIPHGPIFSIGALVTNLRGGADITATVAAIMRGQRFPAFAR